MNTAHSHEVATLAGGCFWCLEAPFRRVEGVLDVISGYMGGATPDPDYKQVCTGETGHAEVIQVHFDPARIPYRDLLIIFFNLHDPTTLNRQGNDIGTQYRSAIFYLDEVQRTEAEAVIAELSVAGEWRNPIATEVTQTSAFYPAEQYHQNYFDKNPYQPYCQAVIGSKLEKLKRYFSSRLKSDIM